MKKFIRRYLIAIILIMSGLSIFLFTQAKSETDSPTKTKQTQKVSRGDIQSSIKVSGKAELVDEQKLRFTQTGTVAAVYFKTGAQVKKGEIIAELDKSDFTNDLKQAQVSLDNSQISLNDLLKGNKQTTIDKQKNAIKDLESNIKNTQNNLKIQQDKYQQTLKNLQEDIDFAKKEVNNRSQTLVASQKKLESIQANEGQSLSSTQNNYQNQLANILSKISSDITDFKDYLNT
nr:biotin/lipoyl-binding protein [Candidatus Gracilibacteria bacterium]